MRCPNCYLQELNFFTKTLSSFIEIQTETFCIIMNYSKHEGKKHLYALSNKFLKGCGFLFVCLSSSWGRLKWMRYE